MKIDIWSDFACPYCYIGEKKLEKALAELALEDTVDIQFKSFQLNVNAVSHEGEDINRLIADKYGIPYEQAKAANEGIVTTAKEVGLNFDFEHIKPGNTGLAHEVYKYCNSLGKGQAMADGLFAGYFEEGANISHEDQLLRIAKDIGVDTESVQHIMKDRSYKEAVLKDQQLAHDMGISSVPFFIINDKYAVSGAQSVENFKLTLEKAKAL